MIADEMTIGEMAELTVDEKTVDEKTADEKTVDEKTVDETKCTSVVNVLKLFSLRHRRCGPNKTRVHVPVLFQRS